MKARDIPIEEFRERVTYNSETGEFTWLLPRKNAVQVKIGEKAGGPCGKGYDLIGLGGIRYAAHRVAWAMHYGVQPAGEIDHINGNRRDNRIINLRCATRVQNLANAPSRNKYGHKGIRFDARRQTLQWWAVCQVNRQKIYLGRFETAEEASLAYEVATEKLYGKYAFHLRPKSDVTINQEPK